MLTCLSSSIQFFRSMEIFLLCECASADFFGFWMRIADPADENAFLAMDFLRLPTNFCGFWMRVADPADTFILFSREERDFCFLLPGNELGCSASPFEGSLSLYSCSSSCCSAFPREGKSASLMEFQLWSGLKLKFDVHWQVLLDL